MIDHYTAAARLNPAQSHRRVLLSVVVVIWAVLSFAAGVGITEYVVSKRLKEVQECQ